MDRFDSLFNLAENVAVVTGASSGLGRRAAEVISVAGAKVVGVARRTEVLESLAFCSEASRYVTGQVLMVDGGFTAK